MRILGRLLSLLLLVIAAAFLYQPLRTLFQAPSAPPDIARQLDLTALKSTVYFMPRDGWLTFPIISQAARLRILTHAGIDPQAGQAASLRYTLGYQLLDGNQRPLHEGRYTHETRIPRPLVKDGIPVPRNLYTDRELAVAAGQSFNLRLDAIPDTAYVRLRLESLATPIDNIAVRVYYEERMSERRASVAWERLSLAQRERLARGVIYPPELLTRQEQLHLLARQWQPVGPIGTNAAQSTLFSLQGADPMIDPDLMPRPPGLYTAPDRRGVLPVSTAGRYRIQFRPLAAEDIETELGLRHFTEQFELPREERVVPEGQPPVIEQRLAPGLLVVTPNQPGMLDIWPVETPGQSALPEPRYLRTWVVQPGLPVRFGLLPGDDVRTALRVDLRAHGDGEPLPAESTIRAEYRMLDARGGILDQGMLEATVVPSMLDRVIDTQPVADLSEPTSFFLRVPPAMTRLEVTSDQHLLVNAYTRPDDLPHRTRVPIDYYAWRGDDPAQPGWFILQPPNAGARQKPSAEQEPSAQDDPDTSLVLHLQSRPPERDLDLLAGRYQWQAFDPQLSARGARILVPLGADEQLRPSGLPAYFQPLEQGRSNVVDIATPGVARRLEPQLVYLRNDPDPFSLLLRIDGNPVRHELIGRRGEISLPPLSPGRHEIELDANTSGTWLMNYRYPDETGYLRRMAFRLDQSPLRYAINKSGDNQVVSARFYSLGEAGAESTVRVRITADVPEARLTQEWTYRERLYQMAPGAGEAGVGYVLDQQRERIAREQSILFTLGSDVPDGPVEVEFSLQSGSPGYLLFNEVLPGEYERTRSFSEDVSHGTREQREGFDE